MIRNLDQLELSIKALSLYEHDILVIRVENAPTIDDMRQIQQGIANLMSGLDLGPTISYVVLPRTLEMSVLNEEGMARQGWVRSFEKFPV